MKEDIDDILNFSVGLDFKHFTTDPLSRKAICMSLINIGELTKSLSASYKAKYKEVPWKLIAGLRDVTAHKYHTLNLDVIWSVVTIEIPKLDEFISIKLIEYEKHSFTKD
ncbi:HepT-like ribonuclease domain-containing protein [Acidaminobacter hydrogenoformans]|nr:HepT-like ribonuclease domain-containing protein [Acidaminobacter hydrogenoformans]